MANDYFTPEAVANEALDAAGVDFMIGNLQEGTTVAQAVLRKYNTCLRQLLRTAHWSFARKEADLFLIADASGQTPNVGTLVPANFLYSYLMPTDCAKVRYIPATTGQVQVPVPSSNITPNGEGSPLTTGTGQPYWRGMPIVPTRFLVTNDVNYIPEGAGNDLPGISPIGQTVICSNQQFARCIYTFQAAYPNLWDELFRSAMVAYLASEVAMPLAKDKKFGVSLRDHNIAIAKDKIREARATSANETWANSDLAVDWMRVRNSGGYSNGYGWGGPGGGPGYLFGGYDGIFFGENSSAY